MSDGGIPPRKIPEIGQAMIKAGVINPQQLTIALSTGDKYNYRLASALVMANILDEATATRFLSKHHGIDGIILPQSCFKLDPLALIPKDVALKKLALPLKLESRTLTIALADPKDIMLIDELSFMTGKRIVPLIALEKSLKDNIPYAYSQLEQKARQFRGKECKGEAEVLAIVHYQSEQLEAAARNLNAAVPQHVPKAAAPAPPAPPAAKAPPAAGNKVGAPSGIPEEYRVNPSSKVEVLPLPAPKPGGPTPLGPAPKTASALPPPIMREEIPPLIGIDQVLPTTPAPAATAERPLLLIVDDDQALLTSLREQLRQEYTVHTAHDGPEAAVFLQNHRPALILMDGTLQGLHGFELCKQLKGSPRFKEIPIIVSSAKYSGWEFRQDIIKQYGADDFLEKPFTLAALQALFNKLLKNRRPTAPPPAPAASQEQQILNLFKEGKWEEALQLCASEAARDPLNAEIHYLKGVVLEKKEADFEAIEELEKAASIDPKHFNALRKLATLYQKHRLLNKAMETWMRAATAAPTPEIKEKIKQLLIKSL